MTMRAVLPLFALFLALLPACGESADAGYASSGPDAGGGTVSNHSTAGSASGNSPVGGSGAAFLPGAGASDGAGYGGVANSGGTSSLGNTPPATWNSAKSVAVSPAQLETEYASWKSTHVATCTNGSKVVVKEDGAAVSEGIGYGMLLSVAMADQPLFDGLWKFYQDHLDKNGLMNWKTDQCAAPGNNNANAATDADLDVTMALIQASSRWPAATPSYLAKAEALAAKIIQFESDMCDGRRILRPGDAFGGCSDQYDRRINPSYFSPGYYKVFAHYFSTQAAAWTALSDSSYQLYAIYQARMNNLVPDWSAPDGGDYNGSQYWYEACRTPWRVAVDYAWSGDTRAKTFMTNISRWVDEHGGLPKAAQQQNSAFVGAFALAAGYDQGKFDGYVSSWLAAPLDDAPYYQGTLRLLYLLVATGKFSSTR
ncbi:MAG TPA: glycosyl hydrolase family 8 [Polyangiaceae bacterium]|nr:glycosyl hydrolase family 8 [Polyangiaceae bacterium]